MNIRILTAAALSALVIFSSGIAQEKVDYSAVLGKWKIEVDADGQYYYLTMELKQGSGKLEGTVSEAQGAFTDKPLENLAFDGTLLSFEFNSPTPPDGLERLIKAEFKLAEGKLDGTVNIPSMGVSVRATATKEGL
jgi:hypothetical protein